MIGLQIGHRLNTMGKGGTFWSNSVINQSFRMVAKSMQLASEAAKRWIARIRAAGERESPVLAAGDGSSAVATEHQAVPGAASPR